MKGIDNFEIQTSYQISHLFYLFQFQSILFLKIFKLGNFVTVSFISQYFFSLNLVSKYLKCILVTYTKLEYGYTYLLHGAESFLRS
jgi:hypothetical protein